MNNEFSSKPKSREVGKLSTYYTMMVVMRTPLKVRHFRKYIKTSNSNI